MQAIKRPGEVASFEYEFADQLGAATIVGIAVGTPVAIARDGGALITVVPAPTLGAQSVTVKWAGGVAGESYLTTVRVTDTNGDTHERTGEIIVVAADFALPKGIASRYLTGEEFVQRYGTAEAIRLTDEVRSGNVDSGKLEAAIGDATDEADAYIGTRYAIPLISPPRVVKSIVAVLAREKLHKTRPTPEVKDAADRARLQLRDISAKRMTLAIDGGTDAPVDGDRSAQTSGDGTTSAFLEGLAGFNLSPGFGTANWRR